ncbi:unnamed protein product [Symbiodinium necroappetens]|uniref:Uncharacterized protein n=1 Tax=Symbiodinium necroappetens TaxID=1628268 RepID=A0A813ACM3_9DINO|nr:unnamed protein product [Symbiodinium necroappetens]
MQGRLGLILFVLPIKLANSEFEGCEATVAHCIVGHVRSFTQRDVYSSIHETLASRASSLKCARFFYVLGMSSESDTSKGGRYDFEVATLQATAWQLMPPTDFILDPAIPRIQRNASFHHPSCLFQCVHMFDKVRDCFALVKKFEEDTGHAFSWIVRSRPDLKWHADKTQLPALHQLPLSAVYFAELVKAPGGIFRDPVQIVPRRFAEDIFDRILDRCLLRQNLRDDDVWNCDTWLVQLCEERDIAIRYLRLYAVIERLPSIEDSFHTYHDQWSQHVKNAELLFPNSTFVIGNEDQKHASQWSNITAGLPGRAFADVGCNLVADSQYCTPTNAYLIHLRLALYVPAANRQQQIKFVLFRAYGRDIRFQGRHSRFNANATAFWPLFTLPYNLIELAKGVPSENAGISYNLFRPVLMRRGDCIFWTACAEDEAEDLPSEALDYPKRRVASRCLDFPEKTQVSQRSFYALQASAAFVRKPFGRLV